MPSLARTSWFYRLLRGVLISAGILILTITLTPAVPWAARWLTAPATSVDHGTLILLSGATVTYDDAPDKLAIGINTYWRVIQAIDTWRHGKFSKILLSGAGTDATVKPILIAYGIPESAIVVENGSTTTRENALFTKPILAGLPGPYVLVTSDYHVFRASRVFARQGVPVTVIPATDLYQCTDVPLLRWDSFWLLVSEYSKIGYYWAHGWI